MWNKNIVFLTGILATFSVQAYPSDAERIDPQFPLGKIGCLFTRSDSFCGLGSRCIDDLLFGTCFGPGIPDDFVYTLSQHDLKKLQTELFSLVEDDFKWTDTYTQCILQNVILSLSTQEPFSKKICYELIFKNLEPASQHNDFATLFSNLYPSQVNFNEMTQPEQLSDEDLIRSSQKRDEIIRVHKYFDKSTGQHKRQYWPSKTMESPYLSYYPTDNQPTFENSMSDPRYDNNELSQVSLNDLELAERYLQTLKQQEDQSRSKLSELLLLDGASKPRSYSPQFDDAYIQLPFQQEIDQSDVREPGYNWREEDRPFDSQPTEDEQMTDMEALGQPVKYEQPDTDFIPPYLANKLDLLVKGEIEPKDLSDEELTLITPYVTNMLQQLGQLQEGEEGQEIEEPGNLQDLEQAAMETGMVQQLKGIPFGTEEEDMMLSDTGAGAGSTGVAAADDDVILTPQQEEALKENVIEDEQTRRKEQFLEKKSANGEIHKAVKKEDVVDVNYAFIKMDKPLTGDLPDRLLEALQKVVTANPGTLNNVLTVGSELKINVDPMLAGVNASTVASQASQHSADLEKATGLKFLEAGIGNENEVGIKATNDRDFLVTFILCGCIASILLAVVVIYLIRRNTRSKEKLKQIASVQEGGNEAASKDYQDLCRQRMQSKSSEKPEPLHAASRVGSVSESQVRSPSSRSSTSSWSEEPVNSNMDISTGHIVLSYMEDHLKNKDRLDREWEAMCAYEADPSSTKVAEDPANNRKNRYTDVLPYDHSRVVLTTNTNVSGSDFINANTITDHDPRNPAYVATQGPLPHTVADFWQMVWEQGSVVIVMLTKLTENGEAKCHRYWPEEGSDLYHIYEVHLVSEHIWCEDYLVRSFYLKNLQTSETRTVTQFHFLTWPDLGIPSSIKALLDFRRKVNKSYRGRSCPIVVHCSDGCGRTGTYCLIDMVLNRMAKGAKEIDIAATLEHIRDQRMNMVKTKEQFQFALAAVAEEVHAILKALPQ